MVATATRTSLSGKHQIPIHYALSIEELSVQFGGLKAVDKVTLYIEEGELRVIIGPNGAGKTTLLDMICGRTKPTSGKIDFQDHVLNDMAEQEIVAAGVGRKFQTPSIYPKLIPDTLAGDADNPVGIQLIERVIVKK